MDLKEKSFLGFRPEVWGGGLFGFRRLGFEMDSIDLNSQFSELFQVQTLPGPCTAPPRGLHVNNGLKIMTTSRLLFKGAVWQQEKSNIDPSS